MARPHGKIASPRRFHQTTDNPCRTDGYRLTLYRTRNRPAHFYCLFHISLTNKTLPPSQPPPTCRCANPRTPRRQSPVFFGTTDTRRHGFHGNFPPNSLPDPPKTPLRWVRFRKRTHRFLSRISFPTNLYIVTYNENAAKKRWVRLVEWHVVMRPPPFGRHPERSRRI